MQNYIAFNKDTGTITHTGCSLAPELQIDQDEEYILTDSPISIEGFKIDTETKALIPCDVIPTIMDVVGVAKESDAILNAVISKITPDVNRWRRENYVSLRHNAYPSFLDYLDAQVKLSYNDPNTIGVGQSELDTYNEACLAVKARFPKPEIE